MNWGWIGRLLIFIYCCICGSCLYIYISYIYIHTYHTYIHSWRIWSMCIYIYIYICIFMCILHTVWSLNTTDVVICRVTFAGCLLGMSFIWCFFVHAVSTLFRWRLLEESIQVCLPWNLKQAEACYNHRENGWKTLENWGALNNHNITCIYHMCISWVFQTTAVWIFCITRMFFREDLNGWLWGEVWTSRFWKKGLRFDYTVRRCIYLYIYVWIWIEVNIHIHMFIYIF